MSLRIPSNRDIFRNFQEDYEETILPFLNEQEATRQRAIKILVTIMAGAVVAAIIIKAASLFGESSGQVAIFVMIAGAAASFWRFTKSRREISHGLFERVAAALDFKYEASPGPHSQLEDFKRLKLLPRYDSAAFEDHFEGVYENTSFSLCEAHFKLEQRGDDNRSERTVFHGQLIAIDAPKRFLGHTVIQRDKGVFNRLGKPSKAFQRVGLASPAFEKIFEAWSTDQVEARDLLDPLMLERFEALEGLYDGANLCAAFTGGKALIALRVGDRLNMGSMFQPLADDARVENILKELDLIFDLIDVLTKRVDGKLDGPLSAEALRA